MKTPVIEIVDFKEGGQQSMTASQYFEAIVDNFCTNNLPLVDSRDILFLIEDGTELPLRIWIESSMAYSDVREMVPWILTMLSQVESVGHHPEDKKKTTQLVKEWICVRHARDTFFIEVLGTDNPFTKEEEFKLFIGVVDGKAVILSTSDILYVKLEESRLYGLALAPCCSYLFEEK